jgi:hypothetical protein
MLGIIYQTKLSTANGQLSSRFRGMGKISALEKAKLGLERKQHSN